MNWTLWWNQIQTWFEKHETLWGWVGALSAATFVGTLIAVFLILILLPQNYLKKNNGQSQNWPPLMRIPYLAVKNVFGIFLIMAGLAMLVLPGQGLLTLFLGILLIDFPRKRRVIRHIVRQHKILHFINRLRAKANKPPLEAPEKRIKDKG